MILSGDIGGTKTRLALWDSKSVCKKEKKYLSKDYIDLFSIIQNFLQGENVTIDGACFGIPGPIEKQVAKTTNLPWVVAADLLAKQMGISHVYLLNDLQAHAYGLELLSPEEMIVFQKGEKMEGNKALISAGTGLGEAGLYWDGKEHHPFACEGGHVDFAPHNQLEVDLLFYLKKIHPHVSYERILSGSGIYDLYQFLVENEKSKELPEIRKQFQEQDPAKVITEHAQNKSCSICVKVIDLFVRIYGSEAGNLALKMLSLNGLYVGGGIAPKIFQFYPKEVFLQSFVEKGRFKNLLSRMPVHLVLNEKTALLGTLQYAMKKIGSKL